MDKKTMRYVAGALFALNAILRLVFAFGGQGLTIWSFVWPVGLLLIAAGLFIDLPVLSTVGGFILAAYEVRQLLVNLELDAFRLDLLAFVVALVLLAIIGLSPKTAKTMGILSAVFYVLEVILLVLRLPPYSHLSSRSYLYIALFLAGVILMGIAFSADKPKETVAAPQIDAPQSELSEKLDRLIRLKDLLDKGVLTQEEFEAKKREVLG